MSRPDRMALHRQQRQQHVRSMLCALTDVHNAPIPSETLAARTGLRTADVIATLHELELKPGPGPLYIRGGWTWVD